MELWVWLLIGGVILYLSSHLFLVTSAADGSTDLFVGVIFGSGLCWLSGFFWDHSGVFFVICSVVSGIFGLVFSVFLLSAFIEDTKKSPREGRTFPYGLSLIFRITGIVTVFISGVW